jgi:multiple sugar transport system permease protein
MTASGICPAAATGADHFTNVAYLSIFDDPTRSASSSTAILSPEWLPFWTVLISILIAYGFSRYSLRFKNTLDVFIISTQTVPPMTLLIPCFGMVVAFGVLRYVFRSGSSRR